MYQFLILSFYFTTVVFTAPKTKNLVYVPGYPRNAFERHGDILELTPQYARKRNLVVGENKIWDKGVVPFYISPELEVHRTKIYIAMNHISNRTCIRFRPKTDKDKEYVYLYNGGSCFATVGRVARHVPVSLGPGCEKLIPAAHEIMHSLGVDHTQSRSDRDDYITVHYENMDPRQRHNFRKRDPNDNQLLVPFDFDSIMLYGPYMASINGRPVMSAKDPRQPFIGTYQKPGMSDLDIKGLNMLYKCKQYGPEFPYYE